MTSPAGVRLRIAPRPALHDHLHGAWWPASTDITRELAPMLAGAATVLPSITGVSLNRDEWPDAPLHFQALSTRSPTISWYGLTEPHLAVLHYGVHRKLALLVIPPDTAEPVATVAMRLATAGGNRLSAPATLELARSTAAETAGGTAGDTTAAAPDTGPSF